MVFSHYRRAAVVASVLSLTACDYFARDSAPSDVSAAARNACRQQAEQSYDVRNRPARYLPDYGRDSPLSGASQPEITRGLADRYGYNQDYLACLRGLSTHEMPVNATLPKGPNSAPNSGPNAGAAAGGPAAPLPRAATPPSSEVSVPASSSELTRPPGMSP